MGIKLKTIDEIRDVSPDEDTDIIAQRIYDWVTSNYIENVKLDRLVKLNFHNNFVYYASDKDRVKSAMEKLVVLGVLETGTRCWGYYRVIPPPEKRPRNSDFI